LNQWPLPCQGRSDGCRPLLREAREPPDLQLVWLLVAPRRRFAVTDGYQLGYQTIFPHQAPGAADVPYAQCHGCSSPRGERTHKPMRAE
jgi:hypothetical protein